LGHSTEKFRKFLKTIDSVLKLKLLALNCFFHFLSTMIFHGVRVSFVKNAGLSSKLRNSVKKNRRDILKKAFCRQNIVVYEALFELFEKNSSIELQSVKDTKF
jgi:hypothetical protein